MKIDQIKVIAGRTFNHPFETYSNLRPEIQLTATVEAGDDPEKCVKELQAKAESMVEDHKQNMLRSLHMIRAMDARNKQMAKLESLVKTSQEELDRYRANPFDGKPPLDFFGSNEDKYCDRCGQSGSDCRC